MHGAADRTFSPPEPVRVLFVAGMWHNGSTIAGSVLGGADGVFFAGEVRLLFREEARGGRCGCGARLLECPLWSRITARAGLGARELARLAVLERRLTPMRNLPRTMAALRGRGALAADARELTDALRRLYRAIADETGCRLIVDSSKWTLYGTLLQGAGIDLAVLHLVRDPRGWCWSSLRRGHPAGIGTANGALLWDLFSVHAEAAWGRGPRALRVRYEDLVRNPEDQLRRVLEVAGLAGAALPFTGPHEVLIEPGHTAEGNENRFTAGRVAIRPDDEWRERLPARDFAVVTALTWPLLLRYGYRLRRRSTASASTASMPATIRSRE